MKPLIAAIGAVLLLGGCTGVPTSSAPMTIEPIDPGQSTESPATAPPNLDSDPRTIVTSFLDANVSATGSYATARAYLTSGAFSRWSTTTATIIADDRVIGFPQHGTITVYGRVVGNLNQHGIYTPQPYGNGGGGQILKFDFKVVCVGSPQPATSCRDGQWKISNLPAQSGLLLTEKQFRSGYQKRVLYFYDLADTTLIPDLRWSSLDGQALATWQVKELATGPRPDLLNAVSTDTMPAQLEPSQVGITLGTPTAIEIPGSSNLEGAARDRLAAEVSQTLSSSLPGRTLTITDGGPGNDVSIPAVHGVRFSSTDFETSTGPPLPDPTVYYLVGGHLHDDTGRAVPGPLSHVVLTSVALCQLDPSAPLLVAGVVGSGSSARLEVGTTASGLRPTSVHGDLTRPSFVPGTDEVWVGDGTQVYRVNVGGGAPTAHVVPIGAFPGNTVVALRVSPEGDRVAIVTAGTRNSRQLSVGSIVRSAGSVSVDVHTPISPPGVGVNDVAWLDPLKLFGIGYLLNPSTSAPGPSRTFETGVDGTDWTNNGISNLPNPPDFVTAATAANVWVSVDGSVFTQAGSSWVAPGPGTQTPGAAPVYLE